MGTFLALTIFTVLAAMAFHVYVTLDMNKRVYNHRPGKCELVHGPEYGSEDVELVPSHGVAFISSGLYYMHERPKHVVGKIFLYKLKQSTPFEATPLDIVVPKGTKFSVSRFHPHGISHTMVNGKVHLYVVCHSQPDFKHTVEVFEYDDKNQVLNYVKTITNNYFVRPNDLYVLSEDRFVFTNDGSGQTSFLALVEAMFLREAGSVAIYDHGKTRWLVEYGVSPNGITYDPKRKQLYVASPYKETITQYDVQGDFDSVSKSEVIHTESGVDNLHVDERGDIWTGSHPIMKALFSVIGDSDNVDIPTPSQVLRVRFSADRKTHAVEEVFADDGSIKAFGGTSVAAPWGNEVLIGTVYRKLLHCYITDGSV